MHRYLSTKPARTQTSASPCQGQSDVAVVLDGSCSGVVKYHAAVAQVHTLRFERERLVAWLQG